MAKGVTEMILDQAHSAVTSLDQQGVVTYWNPNAERMFGITSEDARGRAVADLIVPERDRAAYRDGIKRFLAEGVGPMPDRCVELEALRADGSELPIELTVTVRGARGSGRSASIAASSACGPTWKAPTASTILFTAAAAGSPTQPRLLIELNNRSERERWQLRLVPPKHEAAALVLRATGTDTSLPFVDSLH